jgi:hypothetical protein
MNCQHRCALDFATLIKELSPSLLRKGSVEVANQIELQLQALEIAIQERLWSCSERRVGYLLATIVPPQKKRTSIAFQIIAWVEPCCKAIGKGGI